MSYGAVLLVVLLQQRHEVFDVVAAAAGSRGAFLRLVAVVFVLPRYCHELVYHCSDDGARYIAGVNRRLAVDCGVELEQVEIAAEELQPLVVKLEGGRCVERYIAVVKGVAVKAEQLQELDGNKYSIALDIGERGAVRLDNIVWREHHYASGGEFVGVEVDGDLCFPFGAQEYGQAIDFDSCGEYDVALRGIGADGEMPQHVVAVAAEVDFCLVDVFGYLREVYYLGHVIVLTIGIIGTNLTNNTNYS